MMSWTREFVIENDTFSLFVFFEFFFSTMSIRHRT
jgi:hypothetical protein